MNIKVGIVVIALLILSSSLVFTYSVKADSNTTANQSQSPIPQSSSNSTMTASLAESASALNFGNKINFTVSVDGGVPPYTFAWYVDGQLAETSASKYYSTNTLQVGSHHVNVQVNDANGNSATTLGVAFEVLIALSSSSIPTQQPISSPDMASTLGNNIIWYLVAGAVIAVVVLSVFFLLKRKSYQKAKRGS